MLFDFILDIIIILLWLLIPSLIAYFSYPEIQVKQPYSNISLQINIGYINTNSDNIFYSNKERNFTGFSKNCTLNMVLISNNMNIFNFPHFKSSFCNISETFYYIHSGAGKEINPKYKLDDQIKDAKIVRVNGIDDGNLFGFALSIYFPSTYVSMIDVDYFNGKDIQSVNSWIDESIYKMQNGIEISFSNSINPFAIVAFQSTIRHFLLYTDVKYSNKSSLSILYDIFACRYPSKYVILNEKNDMKINSCDVIPNEWKCEAISNSNETFAVLIPTFKRNYLSRSISTSNMQNKKPNQIIIVQNRIHTSFNFNDLEKLTAIPLRHFWCTNWNSYFYLTYSAMMFIHDKYFIKIDDDYFFDSSIKTERMFNFVMNNPNSMGGVGNRINRNINCGCRTRGKYDSSALGDFISLVAIMYSSSGKILHRFEPYSYFTAEDVSVSFTNAIECNVKSISINGIKGIYVGKDGLSHAYDKDFKNKGNLVKQWKQTNCHYIVYGYHPVSWESYVCDKPKRELRLPH